jgi:hypothetical protein
MAVANWCSALHITPPELVGRSQTSIAEVEVILNELVGEEGEETEGGGTDPPAPEMQEADEGGIEEAGPQVGDREDEERVDGMEEAGAGTEEGGVEESGLQVGDWEEEEERMDEKGKGKAVETREEGRGRSRSQASGLVVTRRQGPRMTVGRSKATKGQQVVVVVDDVARFGTQIEGWESVSGSCSAFPFRSLTLLFLQEKCDRCQETVRMTSCRGPRMLGGFISPCIVCKKAKKPCSFVPAPGSKAAPVSVGDDVVVPWGSTVRRTALKRA